MSTVQLKPLNEDINQPGKEIGKFCGGHYCVQCCRQKEAALFSCRSVLPSACSWDGPSRHGQVTGPSKLMTTLAFLMSLCPVSMCAAPTAAQSWAKALGRYSADS